MPQYGRNKTYRVVFEEKEKQRRKREKDSEDPLTSAVAYVDTARLLAQWTRYIWGPTTWPIHVFFIFCKNVSQGLTISTATLHSWLKHGFNFYIYVICVLEISLWCWKLGIYLRTLMLRVSKGTPQRQVPRCLNERMNDELR